MNEEYYIFSKISTKGLFRENIAEMLKLVMSILCMYTSLAVEHVARFLEMLENIHNTLSAQVFCHLSYSFVSSVSIV